MAELLIDGIDSAVMMIMEVDDFESPQATELSNLLKEMADEYRSQGVERAADALQNCVEQITPDSNYGSAIQQISKTMSCLQDYKLHGKSLDEIVFPNEGDKPVESNSVEESPSGDGIDVTELLDALNDDTEEVAESSEETSEEFSVDDIDFAVMKLMEVDDFESNESNELTNLLMKMSDAFAAQGEDRPSVALKMCVGQMTPDAQFGVVIKQISNTLSVLQDYKIHGKSLDDIAFPNEGNAPAPAKAIIQDVENVVAESDIPENNSPENAEVEAEVQVEENVVESSEESETVLFTGDPDLLALFIQDATENLENVEADLLVLEENPNDPDALGSAFRSFHSVKGCAGFAQLVPIEKIAHAMEELLDLARDGKLTLQTQIMDLILATLDCIRVWVGRVEVAVSNNSPLVFTNEGTEYIEQIKAIVEGKVDLSKIVVPKKTVQEPEAGEDVQGEGNSSSEVAKAVPAKASGGNKTNEAVRVDRQRLDELIDLIGELVITESMVTVDFNNVVGEANEGKALNQLHKITRELQELSLSLRMMSINGLFQKGKRVVRDLSRKLNKSIDLVIEGGETELDKSILDELGDPLVHLIRNSVDHGVENNSAERLAAGKPEAATITLRAFYQGGNIYVEIEDDGAGLSREKLLKRAVERGVVSPDDELTDEQVWQLIMEPGFSTAEKVTEVSGRGVGMDVVRRNIEALRGSVTIQSKTGFGTTISLRLPLTLAIIDGMVVRVQGQRYIIPTLSIVNQMRPEADALATVNGKGELVTVRGHNVPFHRLNRLFSLDGEEKEVTESTIILIEEKDRLAGLLVDEVIGQQQVVIKSLGATLSDSSDGIAGAAVMPDGEVGLILDVHGVLELARGTRAK